MTFLAFLILSVALLFSFRAASRYRSTVRGTIHPAPFPPGLLLLAAFGCMAMAAAQAVVIIPAGHVGVVDTFGRVSTKTLREGPNLVNPLANVVRMSIKTLEIKETMDVPSSEGLSVNLEVSALYHLNPAKAADVYRSLGPGFVDILLVPQLRSVARGVTSGFEARALYTSQRDTLADLILSELRSLVEPRGIQIESTPLRKVQLPAGLLQAIEEKLRAEQESQRMQFVLDKERQEAERKSIEAKGIADFQRIVSEGINADLLRWKGIEATTLLAQSTNAKVVVIGAGDDGLPLILGRE